MPNKFQKNHGIRIGFFSKKEQAMDVKDLLLPKATKVIEPTSDIQTTGSKSLEEAHDHYDNSSSEQDPCLKVQGTEGDFDEEWVDYL